MTEKLKLIVLDYYAEYSTKSKCVYFERIRFIGYELFCNNICLRFQLDNGKQIRRMLNDDGVEYKHVAASDGVKEIVFTIL